MSDLLILVIVFILGILFQQRYGKLIEEYFGALEWIRNIVYDKEPLHHKHEDDETVMSIT